VFVIPSPGSLVIVGAGGFGRECLDIVEALNAAGADITVVGFVDDSGGDSELLDRRGLRCLGPVSSAPQHGDRFVIGIGDGNARARIDAQLTAAGMTSPVLVHPHATLGSDNQLGPGVILNAGARVTTNISLGRHTQIHANATIGHDAVLMDFVSVFPGATVSGSVQVKSGATVGTGANVLPAITIGERSFVGGGAVVTSDVPNDTVMIGVPARPLLP
jgi:sugar O-acyltransferase (sialic acid O-acetyltransferase NeuD family)